MAAGNGDEIKTKLALDGEKEYKAAVKDINSHLRLIGSEMKVVTAEFAGNEKSTEALTKKQEVLQKTLDEQAKKVKEAEEALQRFKDAGMEGSEGAVKMETALNNAKAEMIKTQKEIDTTGEELKNAGREAGGFSGDVQSAGKAADAAGNELKAASKDAGAFSNEIKDAGNESEAAGGKLSKLGSVVGTVAKGLGTGLLAIGAGAVTAATSLATLTVKGSIFADDLLTQSEYTRQTTDDLQKYAYACRFIDADMETLTKSMTKNIKSMGSAQEGTGAAAEGYKKLRVDITNADGSLRNSNDVFWETIDALGNMQNETERDALAMQLLGKSGTELNSIINAGSQAFKELGSEAEAMGAVMSGDQLDALGTFNDKIEMLSASTQGLKNSASMIALPFLDMLATDGVSILGEFSKGIQEASGDVDKMAGVFGKALASVIGVVTERLPQFVDMGISMLESVITGIVKNIPAMTEAATKIINSLCTGLIKLLPLIIAGALQIIIGLAKGIAQALPTLIPQIVEMVMLIVQTLIDNIPLLIECAFQLVVGLVQGILAAIPVLVEAIPKMITSLIDAILWYIPELIQMWITLITSLVDALPDIITAIVAAIPQIIDGIIKAVIGAIPLIIQAGIELLIALVKALPQIIVTIVKAIPDIIGGIIDALINNIPLLIEAGVTLFIALIENLPTIIIEIIKAVPQIVMGIVEAFGKLFSKMVEAGGNLIRGIWEGISGAGAWLWEKVRGFAMRIVDEIKGALGIHSPSTAGMSIGGNLAASIGAGFEGEMRDVAKQIQDATDDAIPKPKPVGGGRGFGGAAHGGGTGVGGGIVVNQTIYANETSYFEQQRQARKNLQLALGGATA